MKLKEISWGPAGDADEVCIYTNGHVPPDGFLEAIRCLTTSDVPDDTRSALTPQDVKHTRFRPMSPSEARSMGYDHGVMEAEEEHRGYPVTAVYL